MISRALVTALAFVVTGAVACKKKAPAAESPAPCATCVIVTDHGFNPSLVTLRAGLPGAKTTLTFTRETEDTCALDIVFPELHVKKPLPLNQAVSVELPTDEAHTFVFQCGMGMYKSSVVVR